MRFALCPSCGHWRAVIGHGDRVRTRRHGSCGVVPLPRDVTLRT